MWSAHRGGSAGIRNLYSYVTFSGDIRYDNRSYAVVAQWKSRVRRQISAPFVQAEFVLITYPSSYMYFRWSRVHIAIKTAVSTTIFMWEHCKSQVQLEASEIGEIQAPVAHESRVLLRPDLHQVKHLFLYFLKILTWWGDIPFKFVGCSITSQHVVWHLER